MLALIPTDWIKMTITDILRPFEEYDILLSPTVCLWDNFRVRLIWDLKTEAPDGISDYKVGTHIFVRGIMSTRAKPKVTLGADGVPQAELDFALIVHQIESLEGSSFLATVKRSKRRRLHLDIIETRYPSIFEQKTPLEELQEENIKSELSREDQQGSDQEGSGQEGSNQEDKEAIDQEISHQEQNETLEGQSLGNGSSEEVNENEEQKRNEKAEDSADDLVETL
ncbi:hypothetical protein BGX21_003899 [Mortierella sp. AD011]|nr:hypothetical protein BGX20_006143 [Mortierella sp. AD010]KAF9404011.1 hypothetical protein BGX21_003899 [Mortierella sp. AD011]